jgi:hypothetical protein
LFRGGLDQGVVVAGVSAAARWPDFAGNHPAQSDPQARTSYAHAAGSMAAWARRTACAIFGEGDVLMVTR